MVMVAVRSWRRWECGGGHGSLGFTDLVIRQQPSLEVKEKKEHIWWLMWCWGHGCLQQQGCGRITSPLMRRCLTINEDLSKCDKEGAIKEGGGKEDKYVIINNLNFI